MVFQQAQIQLEIDHIRSKSSRRGGTYQFCIKFYLKTSLTVFQGRTIEHNLILPGCYSALMLKLTLLQSWQLDMISESCVFKEMLLLQTAFLMSKDNASQLWGKLFIYQENIHQPTQLVILFPLAIWVYFSKY